MFIDISIKIFTFLVKNYHLKKLKFYSFLLKSILQYLKSRSNYPKPPPRKISLFLVYRVWKLFRPRKKNYFRIIIYPKATAVSTLY